MLPLKRVTDPDHLLCHRCGKKLNGIAHRECAESALEDTKNGRFGQVKVRNRSREGVYEGVGTVGHSPCRLEDGSIIIPADEARKIREEGFTCQETGVRYGPWANGRKRERSRVMRKDKIEEVLEEIEVEWDIENDKEDLFSLANGYSSQVHLNGIFVSDLEVEDELES